MEGGEMPEELEAEVEPETEEKSEKQYIHETRSRLRKIFVFYSSFGSRCNSDYLRPSQFVKMMIDANIVDGTLTQKKLDLMFISATKGKRLIKFAGYLELLFSIASKKIKHEDDENRQFQELLAKHVMPLFETIYNETDMGLEDQIFNSKIS
jgi:hypothetical protein